MCPTKDLNAASSNNQRNQDTLNILEYTSEYYKVVWPTATRFSEEKVKVKLSKESN